MAPARPERFWFRRKIERIGRRRKMRLTWSREAVETPDAVWVGAHDHCPLTLHGGRCTEVSSAERHTFVFNCLCLVSSARRLHTSVIALDTRSQQFLHSLRHATSYISLPPAAICNSNVLPHGSKRRFLIGVICPGFQSPPPTLVLENIGTPFHHAPSRIIAVKLKRNFRFYMRRDGYLRAKP